MMIKCQVCKHENQMGSIFCHSCGTKLDLNALSPDKVEKGMKKDKKGSPFRGMFGLLLFLAFVALLAALFAPFGYEEYPEPAQKAVADIKKEVGELEAAIKDGNVSRKMYLFSAEELSAYLSTIVSPDKETDGAWKIQRMYVENMDDEAMTIVAVVKLFDQIPSRFTLTGAPKYEDGKVVFEVFSAKMGHVPMLGNLPGAGDFLQDLITSQCMILLNNPTVSNIRKSVTSIELVDANKGSGKTEDYKLKLTFGAPKK